MKKCQFCAEEIQDEAIKCRFCGEFLQKVGSAAPPDPDPDPDPASSEVSLPLASEEVQCWSDELSGFLAKGDQARALTTARAIVRRIQSAPNGHQFEYSLGTAQDAIRQMESTSGTPQGPSGHESVRAEQVSTATRAKDQPIPAPSAPDPKAESHKQAVGFLTFLGLSSFLYGLNSMIGGSQARSSFAGTTLANSPIFDNFINNGALWMGGGIVAVIIAGAMAKSPSVASGAPSPLRASTSNSQPVAPAKPLQGRQGNPGDDGFGSDSRVMLPIVLVILAVAVCCWVLDYIQHPR